MTAKTPTSKLFSRDRMNLASKKDVGQACVTIFDRIQDWGREKQLLALACAFMLMAETAKVPPQDVFTAASNLMYDPMTSTGRGLQFQAMKFHLATDILEKD